MSKVLIITSVFPPYASEYGGTYRISELANFLAKNGIETYVLTIKRRIKKLNTEHNVNKEIRVTAIDSFWGKWILSKEDASGVALIFKVLLRSYLFICNIVQKCIIDEHQFVIKFIEQAAIKIIKENDIKDVIITYPSFSYTLLAVNIKNRFQKKVTVISDFRDPWLSRISNNSLKFTDCYRKIEKAAIESSDLLIFVSDGMRAYYNNQYQLNESGKKCIIVENGFIKYDYLEQDEHFESVVKLLKNENRMVIGYFGTGSLKVNKNGKNFSILTEILSSHRGLAEKVALVIRGRVDMPGKLDSKMKIFRFEAVPNRIARSNMQKVDLCLFAYSKSEDAALVIGGKTYDYLASGSPVWVLAPRNASSLLSLVKKTGKAFYTDIHNKKDVLETLKYIISLWESDRLGCYGLTEEESAEYSRDRQFEKLLPVFSV